MIGQKTLLVLLSAGSIMAGVLSGCASEKTTEPVPDRPTPPPTLFWPPPDDGPAR
jgi:hypothetical protein